MSAYEVQQPITRLRCDRDGCSAEFEATDTFWRRESHGTRREAKKAGWDVPPPYGKGSRRGTDFCPAHAGGVS